MEKNWFDKLLDATEIIKDEDIKLFVQTVIYMVPRESWVNKASKNHHPVDERGEWGGAIHTLRVVYMGEIIMQVTKKSEYEKDISRAVHFLHDACKYGEYGESGYTLQNHPTAIIDFINKSGLKVPDARIFEGIRTHMGQWGRNERNNGCAGHSNTCNGCDGCKGQEFIPQLDASTIAHLADYCASQDNFMVCTDVLSSKR